MPSPYYYYVNAFDATYLEWTEVGGGVYCEAIDYPTNYVYAGGGLSNKREGIWDFPNAGAESAEALTKVELEVYANGVEDPDIGFPLFYANYWDGAAWSGFQGMGTVAAAWAWFSKDITAFIGTWAKVNACRVYLRGSTGPLAQLNVDCIRLKVTTAGGGGLSIPVAMHQFSQMTRIHRG